MIDSLNNNDEMTNLFEYKTLKLDAAYRPIEVINGIEALVMCLIGKAKTVTTQSETPWVDRDKKIKINEYTTFDIKMIFFITMFLFTNREVSLVISTPSSKPKNFESSGMDTMGGGFSMNAHDPR